MGTAKGSTQEELLNQTLKGAQEPTGELEEKAVGTMVQRCGVCKDKAHSGVCQVAGGWTTPDSDPMAGPSHRPRGAMSLLPRLDSY